MANLVVAVLSMFIFHQGSSQILPCQLANGDACPPVLCPNTIVQYSCTVPSSAAYTVWTIPQGYCIPSAPMILNQTAVPTCGVKLPSARCGPFTANCTTATCMTSTLSVIVTSALDGQIITCSYYTSPSQNSTVGNATIFVIQSAADMVSKYTIAGVLLPNQQSTLLLTWTPISTSTFPTSYNISINGNTMVLPSSSYGYVLPALIIGSMYYVAWRPVNCLGSATSSATTFTAGSVLNTAIDNVTVVKNNTMNATISCSFLNNQSFYCLMCCYDRLDRLARRESYLPIVSNISTTNGTEVSVDLYGLTSGQIYYCWVIATETNSRSICSIGVFFSFGTAIEVPLLTSTILPTSTSGGASCTFQPTPTGMSSSSSSITTGVVVGVGVPLVITVLVVVIVVVVIFTRNKGGKYNAMELTKSESAPSPQAGATYPSCTNMPAKTSNP